MTLNELIRYFRGTNYQSAGSRVLDQMRYPSRPNHNSMSNLGSPACRLTSLYVTLRRSPTSTFCRDKLNAIWVQRYSQVVDYVYTIRRTLLMSLSSVNKNILILVVDDFATMRKVVKNCLKSLGFSNVIEAEDGVKALEQLKSHEFKLIVSDWNMPNMMGIDLLRAVRADPAMAKIPFLMVTAESQKENVLAAAQAGVSNYIVKPFTVDQMEAKLEAVFARGH